MSFRKKPATLTFAELCRQNTAPVLRPDSNWVKEDGPLLAKGNVLKALAHPGAPFGSFADRADTDANHNVLKVTTAGTYLGKYGTLVIKANGSYTYKLYSNTDNPAAFAKVQGLSEGETLSESFKYKATDGFVTKGSVLKITIFGTDDPVTITDLTPALKGGDTVVDEDGLPGALLDAGRPGETDANESATNSGDFKITAPDGIDDLIVGGTTVIANGVFLGPVTITTPLGNQLTITAFNPATGVVSYTYTLVAAESHPAAGEDSIFDQIWIKLTDEDCSSATATLDIQIVDDQPSIEVCRHNEEEETAFRVVVDECVPPGLLVVDETDLGTDATSSFSGVFVGDYGADGPGTTTFALDSSGGPTGLVDTLTGLPVVAALEGGAIVGRAGPSGPIVFIVSIDTSTGVVTLNQERAVVHDPNFGPNDFEGLPSDLIKVVATITDKDGDKATATYDAGNYFGFIDDAPSIDANAYKLPKLATDDTNIPDAAQADFSGAFTSAFGNDGPKDADDNDIPDDDALVYELIISNPASGLKDVLTGEDIVLSLNGGNIEGKTAIGGLVAFTIAVDTAGLVTLTQSRALLHPANPDPNEPVFLGAGTVSLKATITDGDLDTASATRDITSAFCFNDDGPIALYGSSAGQVDEDLLPGGIEGGPGDIDAGAGTTTTVATGSVASLFDPGNDQPPSYVINSDAASIATLTALGLESGGVALTYTVAGDTLTASAGGADIFTFQLDATTGQWTFTLLKPLDHPTAGTEDDLHIDFGRLVRIVDADGDWADAIGSVTVTIDDDSPTLSIDNGISTTVTLDETASISVPANIPIGALAPGDDPDVAGSGIIATGTTPGPIVSPTVAFGADGPAASGSVVYSIFVGAVPPGLAITDGSPITLVAVSPTVVAGVVGGAGPFTGQVAFAIAIDAATGVVTVDQYLSLDHPVNPDPNDILSLANSSLSVLATATDADGDQSSAAIAIGDNIQFLDDGPSLTVYADPYAKATLDETATASTAATLGVSNIGDDSDVTGSGAIATGTSMGPVVAINALFGADGPAVSWATVFALNVTNAASGLFVTDGSAITLVEEGGLIVGRVASGPLAGQAAFAISIDASGVVTIEQYLSLKHPVNPDPDDTVFPATGTIAVDVTVTDGDGDSLTRSADISGLICFHDDGPSAGANQTAKLDDDALAGGNPAGTGDDVDAANLSGTLAHSFGSDGPGDIAFLTTGAPTGFSYVPDGDNLLIKQGGTTVLTVTLDPATGAYTVTQNAPVLHALGGGENNQIFTLTYEVTDGDGDTVTGTLEINVDDDTPVASSVINPNLTDDEGKGDFAASSNEGEATPLGSDSDAAGSPATATGGPGTLFSVGADGLQSIAITGPAGVEAIYKLASGLPAQEAVTYTSATDGSGNVTLTANGAISGNTAFTLTINTDGSYVFTQSAALVHPLFNPSNEDDLPLDFEFTVTDKDGDPATGSITVTVDDDTPVGGDVVADVDEVATLTNLMLIVDVSGSMSLASGIGSLSRLDAAKQAMIDLINAYDANGDVVVRLVTFSSGAAEVGSQWMNVSQAIAAIGALAAGGTTNYDAGLAAAQTAFPDAGAITGGQNVSYFLSDGLPNPSSAGIDATEETAWETFLTSNDIVSFALGMGGDVNATALNPIAYNGVTPVETNATIVDNFADLSGVLVGTAAPILVSGTVPGSFGADGGSFSLTSAGAPSGFTYTVSGNTILVKDATTLTTVLTLTLDPTTGAYTVQQNSPIDGAPGTDVVSFVFNVTLTDGDGDGATTTITVNVQDGSPTASDVVAGTLDDDSRSGGLAGGTGDFDPTLSTLSGSLGTSYGSDGPGSISFAALNGTTQVVNGITVSFSWNAGTSTLTANDGEQNVFEVVVNQTAGTYTINLLNSLDHHTNGLADSVETDVTFNLAYVVTDSDNDTANGTLTFTIDDDTPVAGPVTKTINESADVDSNVMLILDISGSMGDPSGLTGLTRLDVLKASVVELLEQYEALGNVAVRLVTFSTNAAPVGSSWTSAAAAKASVLALTSGGSTNYDEALTDAVAAFASGGKISGAQNVSYFISDGEPTAPAGSVGLNAAEQAAWEAFLDSNDVVSHALGAGSGVTASSLDPVAYNGTTGTQISPIVVTDLAQLAATLVSTVVGATTSGNLLTEGSGGFGADSGFVRSVAVGGKTFTYDPATDTISVTGAGAPTHTFNASTNVLTIATAIGGSLSLDLDDGAYSYTGPASVTSNQSDVFTYVLQDGDGDQASSTLTVDILNEDRAPIVRDDAIITNIAGSGATIVIPHFALTHNDTDPDGQAIGVTSVGAPQSDLNTVTNGATSVTFVDNDTDGGTFTYTGSTTSPAGSDTGLVTVTRVGAGTDPLNGNGLANVLINSDNSDTLNGFEGDDVLIGNGGNDVLVGGAGIDLMQGGTGDDTFDFNAAAESATLATADTILDFDTASATERIDLSGIFGGTLGFQIAQSTSTVENTVTWSQDAGTNTTIVRADVNGNTTADFVIKLSGLLTLTAGDFVL